MFTNYEQIINKICANYVQTYVRISRTNCEQIVNKRTFILLTNYSHFMYNLFTTFFGKVLTYNAKSAIMYSRGRGEHKPNPKNIIYEVTYDKTNTSTKRTVYRVIPRMLGHNRHGIQNPVSKQNFRI